MAVAAVQIHGAKCLVALGIGVSLQSRDRFEVCTDVSVVLVLVLVLVLVMTEVRCAGLLLVSAVGRHGRPAKLERQQGKQDEGEETAHGQESSGYRVGAGCRKATGLWPFTTWRHGREPHCGSSHGG